MPPSPPQLLAPASPAASPAEGETASDEGNGARPALELVFELLATPLPGPLALERVLPDLARAFAARGAGLAGLVDGSPVVRFWTAADGATLSPARWPWEEQPETLGQARAAATAVPKRTATGGHFLLTAGGPATTGWLLWLEGPAERSWTAGERAALQLAGLALERLLCSLAPLTLPSPPSDGGEGRVRGNAAWQRGQDRIRMQQRLQDATTVIGRLAHDYGNVLTGILGFTELSLGQANPDSALYRYLNEAYESAQRGAGLTARLKQLSRQMPPQTRPTPLAAVMREEEERVRPQWGKAVALHVALSPQLPAVAVEAEPLHALLAPLLDNAREAITGEGVVTLSAHRTDLTEADCGDLLGNPTPGPYVEITLTDTGCGFSPEARRRAFAEPFFTTKPRHRGLGLTAVHSLLYAYHGGLRLEPGFTPTRSASEGRPIAGAPGSCQAGGPRGSILRIYLPATLAPVGPGNGAGQADPGRERLLVVDGDPLTLQGMTATLERAGYRVQAASDAVRALDLFTAAPASFQLVLADMGLPQRTGFDLVRQALARNPAVRVLFTSSYVPADFPDDDLVSRAFDVLPKPFRPDGLLQAVRAALDPKPHGPAADAVRSAI